MLVKKKITTLKKTILLVSLTIVTSLILYLLYSSFRSAAPAIRNQGTVINNLNAPKIDINFDSSYFNKSPYKDLVQYADLPVEVGALGRSNPFSELPFYTVKIKEK